MPIYEYKCADCGRHVERLQRIDDPPPGPCEACGGDMRREVSAPAFQFKGTGWYVTDYADRKGAAGKDGAAKDDAGSEAAAKDSGSTSDAAKSESSVDKADKADKAKAAAPTEDYQLSRALDLLRGIALYRTQTVN